MTQVTQARAAVAGDRHRSGCIVVGIGCRRVLTLSFTLFFGAHSIGAQTLMTGMLAAIIFLALFVAIQIDHPFTGSVSVGPKR